MEYLEGPAQGNKHRQIPIPVWLLLVLFAALEYWLTLKIGWIGYFTLPLALLICVWILKLQNVALGILSAFLFQILLLIQIEGINLTHFALGHAVCLSAILLLAKYNEHKAQIHEQSLRIKQLEGDLLALSQRMNHDLREPISGLHESLQHMLDNRRSGWNIEEKAGIRGIREKVERLSQVMEDLQKIAEIQRHLPPMQPVSMALCIEKALRRLAHPIMAIKPDFQSPKEWPTVYAHAPWLEEVWFNLISNALKYGGTPPAIHLGHQRQANGEIRFWIEDQGDGIRQENIADFFNGLELLSPGQSEGQGLGLALVKRIIIKLGGYVGVDSTGIPGKGCRIFFTLPLKQ